MYLYYLICLITSIVAFFSILQHIFGKKNTLKALLVCLIFILLLLIYQVYILHDSVEFVFLISKTWILSGTEDVVFFYAIKSKATVPLISFLILINLIRLSHYIRE